MQMEELSVSDIKRGYLHGVNGDYICQLCGAAFHPGEIYPIAGHFYDAAAAVDRHIRQEHGDRLESLLHMESKYNPFTDNQKELLLLFHKGMSDGDIAAAMGVSPSTVRHQRFQFREKAKQMKFFLAAYELSLESREIDKEELIPLNDNAKMVDSRYIITQEEKEKILKGAFSSLSPLCLKALSPKEKKKIVILSEIAKQFEKGRDYTENEVNQILKTIYDDYATLRRYLIEYGFMERTDNCSRYWLI